MGNKILIVDDTAVNRDILHELFIKEYYQIFLAQNAKEALEILEKNEIDIILLDLMMPGQSGIDLCQKLKNSSNTLHIPIIIITALHDKDTVILAFESGADDVLLKGLYKLDFLLARAKILIHNKKICDELRLRNKINMQLGANNIAEEQIGGAIKILVISDDEVQSRNIFSVLLKTSTHVVIEQHKKYLNEEAILHLENFPPDVIIINNDSDIDPLRIFMSIKSNKVLQHAAFFLIVGMQKDSENLLQKAVAMGIDDYLYYPIYQIELLSKLKSHLKKQNNLRQLRGLLEQNIAASIKDSLTGLYNRYYFDVHLNELMQKSQNIGVDSNLNLFLFDIDNFKEINDKHGHNAGDIALKNFADILRQVFREIDLIVRYGGDEFAVLITTPTFNVESIAQRAIETIMCNQVKINGQSLSMSASVGVGTHMSFEYMTDFVKKVDKALYTAKKSGKNKVVIV